MKNSEWSNQYIRQILGMTDDEVTRFQAAEKAGLLELAPVAIPGDPHGDNNHIGWPVAVLSDDTLVVVHRRIPGHNPRGAGAGDQDSTFSMVTTSSDGGATWSESKNLIDSMDPTCRKRGGDIPLSHRYKFGPVNESLEGYKLHLNAIGSTSSGAVVVLCNYGAFRSRDNGVTWTHSPTAFREDTFPGDIVYLGPRILDHPTLGLLAFGNTTSYGPSDNFPNPVAGPVDHSHHTLVVLRSRDEGDTWDKITLELPEWAGQHEPAAMLFEDDILVIGRDQIAKTNHLQMRFHDFDDEVVTLRSNMRNGKYIDTVDFDFNPVTRRLEVARSKREAMRIELFSIDPADWDSGTWRLEGTLLQRQGDFYTTGDGFHPAGAVIDEKRGVQHIFIYTGHPNGPAGSFRLTRRLDTPALSEFLTPR